MFTSSFRGIYDNVSKPIVATVGFCSAILVAVTCAILVNDYGSVIERAGQRNLVLTQVLEENARRAFDLSRFSLDDLSKQIVVNGRPAVSPELSDRMERWLTVNPLISSFWLFDADGFVIYTSQRVKTDGVNFSDRDYFKAHRGGADQFIGAITRGRLDGNWFFSLSKRLIDRNGVFNGVLLSSMSTEYFSALYSRLGLGLNDNIGIYRLDGAVVVRRLQNWTDSTVPPNASPQLLAGLKKNPVGIYRSTSPIDGIDRIIAYRTVDGWPLVVGSGTTVSGVLAEWWSRAYRTVGLCVAILFGLGLAAVWGLQIEERRQAADEAARLVAERASAAKTRFLAAASHDLRQPLQALHLYLELLSSKITPDGADLLARMEQCVGMFQELLSDLLDLSRLDSDVVTPRLTDFHVNAVVDRIAGMNLPEAERKRLSLRVVPTSMLVHTDPALFGRVVANLVSNAVRYTERGGVVIGCRRRAGGYWLEVCDTGVGIPHDKLDVIFEEFQQLKAVRRHDQNTGTGLGLAIARRSVRLLGLEIRVRSQPGKGSMFAVSLPVSAASTERSKA